MSSHKKNLPLKLELLWWIFTLVVLAGVLIPILSSIEHYPFTKINILFVVVFITLARYIFLLRHTFLAKQQKLKAVLIFVSIPFLFFLISQMHFFQTYLDENGVEAFIDTSLSIDKRNSLASFVRNQMMFFGAGAVITAFIFPFRMLMSIWTFRNRGRA